MRASATEVRVSLRPVLQRRPKTITAAKTENAMRPMRTALGGQASMRLKAAPVLSTCERRKTPGMTGSQYPGRMWWMIQILDRRSARMTSAVMRKRYGRRSGVVAGCGVSVVLGVGIVIRDILVRRLRVACWGRGLRV